MIDALARWARAQPAAPAFIADGAVMDFARLQAEIEGMAAALLARGVRPSVPAGLVLHSTPRHFIAMLALFRLGAPLVALAPVEPPDERRAILDRAAAPLCLGLAADAVDGIPHLAIDRLSAPGDAAGLPPPPGLDTVAHFARSSGTSRGVAKMVATTFGHMRANDGRMRSRYPIGPGERYLLLSPLASFFGRQHARMVLAAGAGVIFPADAGPPAAVRATALRHGATMTALIPAMVRDLLGAAGADPVLPGMRLWVGAAPLSAPERLAVMRQLTPRLHVGYGTTEVGGIALADPDDLAVDIETVGRAYPMIEAEAVDDALRPVPTGEIGVLRYRSDEFQTAYIDDVPGASSRFQDGWFYPGDAGAIDAAGRIRLVGRSDDFINVGGRKIHPGDIERVIAGHPLVVEVAVVPIASAREGQVPVAAIVVRAPLDAAEVLAHCRAALPPRLLPRRVVTMDALPRNLAGKVDRAAVLARIEARPGS
ncbi:MAG: class I adenylate-forming enzyme family protein [Alphaproteobacteria bacterium]